MVSDEVRSQLIKQFPVGVIEVQGEMAETYYSCPCCGRPVSRGMDKCKGCEQMLSWDHIKQEEAEQGLKKATLEFEVPRDFVAGDCRRCPISFIGQSGTDRVYECPLNMRGTCKLVIK